MRKSQFLLSIILYHIFSILSIENLRQLLRQDNWFLPIHITTIFSQGLSVKTITSPELRHRFATLSSQHFTINCHFSTLDSRKLLFYSKIGAKSQFYMLREQRVLFRYSFFFTLNAGKKTNLSVLLTIF